MTGKNKLIKMTSLYSEIAFCVYGYHNVNGKDKENGSITQFCKGSDIVSNMYDTKFFNGKVCLYCMSKIPKTHHLDNCQCGLHIKYKK